MIELTKIFPRSNEAKTAYAEPFEVLSEAPIFIRPDSIGAVTQSQEGPYTVIGTSFAGQCILVKEPVREVLKLILQNSLHDTLKRHMDE